MVKKLMLVVIVICLVCGVVSGCQEESTVNSFKTTQGGVQV